MNFFKFVSFYVVSSSMPLGIIMHTNYTIAPTECWSGFLGTGHFVGMVCWAIVSLIVSSKAFLE